MSDEEKQAPEQDDAAIIAECMDRMRISIAADSDNRSMALDDLAFIKGDQWDMRIKQQRVMDGRPCLTINTLPVSLHQITNAQRQNIPSIKVHPATNKDVKKAEVVQGAIRHIEYQSNSASAKDTAVNSAATIGFGYFRLVTGYAREDSFDQEIRFKRIRNPFTVYMDPGVVEIDGSDQKWCILSEKEKRTEFKVNHPKADPCDFGAVRGMGDRFSEWIFSDEVRTAEYYRIFVKKDTVVLLANGESGWKKEMEEKYPGVAAVNTRDSTRSVVQWFKLSAVEILERTEVPCKWIPVFPVYGDEIDIDGRVTRVGMVRNAKDPARMYNYWMTCATEEVGLRPKTPYIGAEGQFEGHEDKWREANVKSFPYLEYKPKTLGGNLAPPPQRAAAADVPTGMLQMAAHARDDVKGTTGMFDASLGARSNETSGIAIKKRDQQGETANYHYIDNLNTTLIHAGRCILDMFPKVYDGTRVLKIMGMDSKVSAVDINKPIQKVKKVGDLETTVSEIMNDMSDVAEYSATISVGPSYDTMRQEAVEGMVQTAQAWPKLMDIAGDKVIRSMDWPMAEEIADRIEKTVPPALKTDEENEDGSESAQMIDTPNGPMPMEEAAAMVPQLMAQLQEASVLADANASKIKVAEIQAASAKETAQINAVSKQDVEELKGVVQLLVAQLQPPPALVAQAMQTGENDGAPGASVAQEQPAQPESPPSDEGIPQ